MGHYATVDNSTFIMGNPESTYARVVDFILQSGT